MSVLNTLLAKPASERRKLSAVDVRCLALINLKLEQWTPSKLSNTLELMQLALRKAANIPASKEQQ